MSIDAEYLINPGLASITEQILGKDQALDIYLHNSQGATDVSGGVYGPQTIETLAWDNNDVDFAESFFEELDSRLDIDFNLTDEISSSDIDIYLDKDIDLQDGEQILGLALTNYSSEDGFFWEIFLSKDDFASQNHFRYGLIHEIAHTLGMEHPFSDDDGDLFKDNNDAWTSTYPEETIMSYRPPLGGTWPNSLSDNDWNALESQWGKQEDLPTYDGSVDPSTPTYGIINTYARSLIDNVLTGSPHLSQNSFDAKFYNLGRGRYGMQLNNESTIDEITDVKSLIFQDKIISPADDVVAVFNQIKGTEDVSGVVFRLYNAAFNRLPDAKGLENWIKGNSSGGMTYATSAQEFSSSQEFQNLYGASTTDTQYITTLYYNVLRRTPDAAGLAHYQNLLANGKSRGALLLDFSESPENRGLFTEVTGLR